MKAIFSLPLGVNADKLVPLNIFLLSLFLIIISLENAWQVKAGGQRRQVLATLLLHLALAFEFGPALPTAS